MAKERLIVIGGDGAGMSAASKARKLKPDLDITVFEKSGYVSYARLRNALFDCGRGEIHRQPRCLRCPVFH